MSLHVTQAEFTTLGEIVSRTGGAIQTGPFGSQLHASDYTLVGTPLVMPINLGDNEIVEKGIARVSDWDARRLRRHALREGDIIFSRRGDVGRRSIVRAAQVGWLCGTGCLAARFGSNRSTVSPEYVAHYLGSRPAQAWLQDNAVGGTMPNLNTAILSALPFRLPSRAEQDAIVAALEDAQATIEHINCLIAKTRAIRHGLIQQLLTGNVRLPGFDDPWRTARLGELLKRPPRYGINAPAIPYSVDAYTYIRITDIDDSGNFTPRPKVSVRHPSAADYLLGKGELVFARTGASVGKSYLFNPDDGELVYAGFLINIAPDQQVLDPAYLALVAQTTQYWEWVARTSVRSGQPGINGREYAQLQITLPEIHEQRAIASTVSDASLEIRALSERLVKAKAVKQGMMQQLLTGRTRLSAKERVA
ncbi:restriction endonuclease subunit S [Streptomyces sp. NPDC003758]